MKKQLFSVLSIALIFSCSPPNQQSSTSAYADAPNIEALQKDTNIQFLGEVEHLFSFDIDPSIDEKKYAFYKSLCADNGSRADRWFEILKHSINLNDQSISDYIETEEPIYADLDGMMSYLIFDQLDNIDTYADKALTQKLDDAQKKDIAISIDTILMFDPDTYKDKAYVVENVLDPRDVFMYKVSAIIFFDKQKTELIYVPTAIAPMKTIYDDESNMVSTIDLFWIPVDVNRNYPQIDQPEYTFAHIHQNYISPNNILDTNMRKQFNTYSMDQVQRIRDRAGELYIPTYMHGEPNDSSQIANLGSSVDTIIIFDPETFEEKVQTVKNEIRAVESFRVNNVWSFNQSTKRIECFQFGYTFIIDRLDDFGNVINSGPIFFHKTR